MRSFQTILISIILLAGSLGPASASDWPEWRGLYRNGYAAADEKVLSQLPASAPVVWKIPVGLGISSPVVAAGHVFECDNQQGMETVHCLNAADSKEIWSVPIDAVFADNQGPSGPRATPLVHDGRVYFSSCRGLFKCLDAATGKELWKVSYSNDFGVKFIGEKGTAAGGRRHGNVAAPAIDGDHIIISTGADNDNSLICCDRKTGKILWHSLSEQAGYAALVLTNISGARHLIDFAVSGVWAVNPENGAKLWDVPIKTALGRHAATPVIWEDWIVVSSHTAGLRGIQVTTVSNLPLASCLWTNMDCAINFSSPVQIDGNLYGVGPHKDLMCVNIKTGATAWSKQGFINSSADKAYAGFIVLGKKLLLLNDTGELMLLDVDSRDCKEVSRLQVCGNNWCNPAYSNGNLFLRDAKELFCLKLAE